MPHLEIGDYIETETITTHARRRAGRAAVPGPALVLPRGEDPLLPQRVHRHLPEEPPPRHRDGRARAAARRAARSAPSSSAAGRSTRARPCPRSRPGRRSRSSCPTSASAGGSTSRTRGARHDDAAADETPRDPRLVRVARGPIAPARARPSRSPPRGPSRGEGAAHLPLGPLKRRARVRGRRAPRRGQARAATAPQAFLYLCASLASTPSSAWCGSAATLPTGPMSEIRRLGGVAVS